MNPDFRADGIVSCHLHGVEMEVGYEIFPADRDVGLIEEYGPLWVRIGQVDISELIDAIPNAWEALSEQIAESVAYDDENNFQEPDRGDA